MQLFIKRLTGELIILKDIKPLDTVDNIKSKIKDKAEIPQDQQRLIFPGYGEMQALDGLKLGDYGISGGETIFLVPKRGGGRKVTRRRRRKRRRKTGRRRKHRRKSRRRKRITRKKTRRRRKNRRKHLRGGASEADMLWVFNHIKATGGGNGGGGGDDDGDDGGGGGDDDGGGGEDGGITLDEFKTALRRSSLAVSMYQQWGPPLFRSARGGVAFGDNNARISQTPLTFDEFKRINNGFHAVDVGGKVKVDGTTVPGNYTWKIIFNGILATRGAAGGGGGGGAYYIEVPELEEQQLAELNRGPARAASM